MLKRQLSTKIANDLATTPKSLMILGHRQTGKSTLLGTFSPALTIDLSSESTFQMHLRDEGLIKSLCRALPKESIVLIDEIQRLPSLFNSVQHLIDQKSGIRFLLTGSSVRKLKSGRANLMPGRLFWHSLYPLTYWELGDNFSLENALTIGTLPEIYLTQYGPRLLKDYVNTYLKEEIKAESLVRSLGAFANFLALAAENSGQISNYSGLASDSEIPKETIRRYYEILQDTLLVHRLSCYNAIDSKRKAVQKEMFILFDLGVRNALLGKEENTFTPTELGKHFEQWFICQIIAFNAYHEKAWKLHYYRDDKKNEVDLIIDTGKHCVAIEVKYAERFNTAFIKGLKAFQEVCLKPVNPYLIYRGSEIQMRDNISVEPYQIFLSKTLPTLMT
jgi:uncharacterized protein